MSEFKTRRSMLYIPGSNTRALDKARNLPADCLIMDLEDAVAPDVKVEARDNICGKLKQGGYGEREIIVRVNGLDSIWGMDDLKQLATAGADGIALPKVSVPQQVSDAVDILRKAGSPKDLKIWAMIETPKGVLNAKDIARSHDQLAGMVMGLEDLSNDLRIRANKDRAQLLYAMSHCVMVARAYDLTIIDGVYRHIHDLEGLRETCEAARDLGFDGKSLIHPKNLEIANEVFAPSTDDIAEAQAIMDAFAQAEKEQKAVALYNGKLIEELHKRNAERILQTAKLIQGR